MAVRLESNPWEPPTASLHEWPERDERTVCLAFLSTFTGPVGRLVLEEFYRLQVQLPSSHELRQALNIVYPYLIDTMRRGQAYQHGATPPAAEPEPPRPY